MEKNEKKMETVIILGSGPAGLSAAIYTARAQLAPLVFTGIDIGGQMATTSMIENYPGFPEGVGGSELAKRFTKNAEKFGARIEYEAITSVDLSKQPLKLFTYDQEYETKILIITTGASPKKLNVPGEKELIGRGVSYCATCDGWFFKNKKVAVVGGGDSALEEGIFLTRFASSVTIIHRRSELRAGALLQKRARENPKISFLWDSVVEAVEGKEAVKSLTVKNVKTGAPSQLNIDGLFIFIGHTPNSEMFRGFVELDEDGYIRINERMETNIPGIYAAGEAADARYRQVVTSAGMGAVAAMEAIHFLDAEE